MNARDHIANEARTKMSLVEEMEEDLHFLKKCIECTISCRSPEIRSQRLKNGKRALVAMALMDSDMFDEAETFLF